MSHYGKKYFFIYSEINPVFCYYFLPLINKIYLFWKKILKKKHFEKQIEAVDKHSVIQYHVRSVQLALLCPQGDLHVTKWDLK